MTAAEKSARYRSKDVEAYREKKNALARTPKHKERRAIYMQEWREKNREKYNADMNAYHKRTRVRTYDSRRRDHLKRKYGITLERFDEMLADQNGKCAICRLDDPRGRNWHVDHDHKTGIIRGILCNWCNTSLGWHERFADMASKYLGVK